MTLEPIEQPAASVPEPAPPSHPWVERAFRRALAEQRRGGREAKAASLYRQVLRREPGHFGSWVNLGVLEFERGQVEEAVRCFRRAHELRPEATEASYNLGKALRALGDRRGAQRFLELAYEGARGDAAVLEELGALYVETERLAAARALAEDGSRQAPEAAAPRVLKAQVLLAQAHFDEAAALLEGLVASRPDCHQALAALGEVRFQQSDLERAALALRRALLVHPHCGAYHRQLGVIQSALGDGAAAQASFRRAKRLVPRLRVPETESLGEDPPNALWERLRLQASLLERARSFAEGRRWRAGVAEFLALTAKYPGEAVVWQELAWFYEQLQEPRRALTLYRRARDLDPRNLEVALRVGRLELDHGSPEATEAVLDGLGEEVREVPEVLELRAQSLRKAGDVAAGRALYEQALERMPNRITALRGLGECLLEEGREDAAIEAWTRAFRAFPGDASLGLELAALLAERGQRDAAERVLRAAIERSPGCTRLHVRLARQLLEARRYSAARKAYQALTLECQARSVEEGVDLLEGLVYGREQREARRLARALGRRKLSAADTARLGLLEALLAVQAQDANRFAPAWQRAWREDPRLDRHGAFMAGMLDAAEMDFLEAEVARNASLFARDPDLAAGLARLAEALRPHGVLRSLPAR